MKIGSVTKINNGINLRNYDIIVFFHPSRKRDSEFMDIKFTFSLTVTFHLKKIEKRTKISLIQLWYYCFE